MTTTRPNIVVINPDQMRGDYFSGGGHPFINTQHLNRLCAMGTCYTQAFTNSPMCGPARASFITGQYPIEHQVRNYAGTMPCDYPNMLNTLKSHGYTLGLFGKDHVIIPDAVGVLYHEGEDICIGNMDNHPDYVRSYDSGSLEKDSPYNLSERLTTQCLAFIKQKVESNRPYYVTLNLQDPHPYFAVPKPYDSLFSSKQCQLPSNFRRQATVGEPQRLTNWRQHSGSMNATKEEIKKAMAIYCGQIRYVDDQVGRIISTLEQLDELDNTIIIFWSDHGEFLGDFGVTHKAMMFYESLMHIPLVIYDPTQTLAQGVNHDLVEVVDIMPTLLELLHIAVPTSSRGQSLVSQQYHPRDDVFAEGGIYAKQPDQPLDFTIKAPHDPTQWGPGAMLRNKTHKLVVYSNDQCELFDLVNDPYETQNYFDNPDYQQVKGQMLLKLGQRQLAQGQDPRLLPTQPYDVYKRNPHSYPGEYDNKETLLQVEQVINRV